MKIAVCDDDIAELNNIYEILNNYFEEKNTIFIFQNSEAV